MRNLSWLKRAARLWLGLDTSPPAISFERQLRSDPDNPPTVADLSPVQLALLRRSDVNSANALDQSLDIKRRFDALTDALGIGFVVHKDGSASMVGIVDNGLFGDSAKHIEATLTLEKLMAAEWGMMRQRSAMMRELYDEFKSRKSFAPKEL